MDKHQELVETFRRLPEDSEEKIELFKKIISNFYAANRRSFPWRQNITSYAVVVSEIMLQQTQADRVAQKFEYFIRELPDYISLAQAPFYEVLKLWKGLGYNRRAMALQKIAQRVIGDHDNKLPEKPEILETFPSIGKATASSIVSFAFNIPTVFIETNIRTVFIYFFFPDQNNIHDKQIMPLVEKTLDKTNPREWYYALMDYGVWLKKTVGNLSRLSLHYSKQGKFEGSDRQIRGQVLEILLAQRLISQAQICEIINKNETRVGKIIARLCAEGYIETVNQSLCLKSDIIQEPKSKA